MTVFIADDSILIRNIVKELLASDPTVELVGEAANGADAVRGALRLCPDIVIMDIDMPIMNGLEATSRITQESGIPVLVFTHNTDPELPFKALELGAVDFLLKPDFSDLNKPDYVGRFLSRLKVLSKRRVVPRRPRAEEAGPGQRADACGSQAQPRPGAKAASAEAAARVGAEAPHDPASLPGGLPDAAAIAIGASTGGPQAVCLLLSGLASPFPLPITLVQHIETGFDKGYADWLSEETGHAVELARNGTVPRPGKVYVSPTDIHLRFSESGFVLDDGPKVLNQKPSVDVLFESAARLYGPKALGILLTGMGTDGAEGCAAIRARGGYTLVQDEASSLIFGMPKAAISRNAASLVLPLDGMPAFLAAVAGKRHGR